MLAIFSFMFIGFILKKKNILADDTPLILSRLETFVFVPALMFYNMTVNCTVENFIKNYKHLLYSLIFIIFAIFLSYPISKLFVNKSEKDFVESYKRSIYKYASTFGNFGFVGNYIILGIWGSEAFFKFSIFTLALNFFTNT